MSDSECDLYSNSTTRDDGRAEHLRDQAVSKRKPKTSSVKKASTAIRKKAKTSDVFNISRSGGEYKEASTSTTTSFFVNRVANGNERRVINTTGDYIVDLKVHRTEDAHKTDRQDLWKKALLRIKFQTNEDTPEWRKLQSLVHSIDSLCDDQPRFISDNV